MKVEYSSDGVHLSNRGYVIVVKIVIDLLHIQFLDGFITHLFISVVRLGKCQKREVAEDAVKEGKGGLEWSSAVTAAPKYLEIKQRELPNIIVW